MAQSMPNPETITESQTAALIGISVEEFRWGMQEGKIKLQPLPVCRNKARLFYRPAVEKWLCAASGMEDGNTTQANADRLVMERLQRMGQRHG